MKHLVPYFVIAVTTVVFGRVFKYPGLFSELVINTVLILFFIGYAQYQDKVLTVFFRKSKDENQDN